MSPGSPRLILARLGLLCVSTLAGVCMAELGLRATLYRGFGYAKSPGPASSYRIRTAEFDVEVRTNSLNMRDEVLPEKTRGRRRVLCLGDSFTFGVGVDLEDTWLKLIQAGLNSRNPGAYHFINAGGLTSAVVAYDYLVKTGLSLSPDAVILQVFLGNDFYDLLSWSQAPGPGGTGADGGTPSWRGLRLADFIWTRLVGFGPVDRFLFRRNMRYGNRGIFLREAPGLERRLSRELVEHIVKIGDLCAARKIPLAVVLIPDKTQLLMRDLLDNERYWHRAPNDLLMGSCARNRLRCLDLLVAMEGLPPAEARGLYYARDLHWTRAGHRFAAREIEAFLEGLPDWPRLR